MGTVNSTSNGLADLLQTLTNENSPLLSTISSPNIQTALANAPAGDIAEISSEAAQLQETDALFGVSGAATPADSLFAALANGGSGTSSRAAGSALQPGSPLADQLAAYQGNMQMQENQALFGTTVPSSAFDVFA
jgi:hypothetical protein